MAWIGMKKVHALMGASIDEIKGKSVRPLKMYSDVNNIHNFIKP